jgi:hypothetical protein
MTSPNVPNHNQAPEPERASLQQYIEAFNAIDLEVKTSGIVEYTEPVKLVGQEWVEGELVQHVSSQPNVDLEMVPATELLDRIPEDKRESLWGLGITPDKADNQVLNLAFADDCYVRNAGGDIRYQPGAASLLITTEGANGVLETANYQISVDRSGDQERAAGAFSEGLELDIEDVPIDVKDAETLAAEGKGPETIEAEEVDPDDLAIEALMRGYRAKEEKGTADLYGFEEGILADEAAKARDYLTPAEVAAMKLVAENYSPKTES